MLKFRELLTWFVLRVACFLTTPALKCEFFSIHVVFGPPPDFRDKLSFKEGKLCAVNLFVLKVNNCSRKISPPEEEEYPRNEGEVVDLTNKNHLVVPPHPWLL